MKRIDEVNLNKVGEFLINNYSWIVSTAMTKNEDYVTDITLTTDNGRIANIEVKTIRNGKKPFKSPYIKTPNEEIWNYNFWMLNKSCNGGRSKWDKFIDKTYDGLIFFVEDSNELIIYNHSQLMDAYLGDIELLQTHTTDFKDKTRQWETKVAIDLDKGIRRML